MSEKDQTLRIGGAFVDLERREVRIEGRSRRLDPKSVEVLSALAAQRGKPMSRDALLACCWGDDAGSDEALTQTISQLRAALGDSSRTQSSIRTLPRLGYLLVEEDDGPARMLAVQETLVASTPAVAGRQLSVLPILALALLALLAALIAVLVLGGNEEKTMVFKQPPQAAAIRVS